jgi:predicted alpha-1,2-mannosidase
MGNEPSFHIPYLYNHLGAPWKTEKRIRMLLETWFTDTSLGIPGDEDGGGMSAFVVFSMMGFYPTVPGVPAYDIGSPVFDSVTIRLHNGKTFRIVCKNNSHDNKYIQSIQLNGKPSEKVWLRHADIVNGGTLELAMGNTPNRSLGTQPANFPPSAMALNPESF